MACNGCNGNFSFGAIFIPFTPLTAQKIKIKKKKKKKKKIKESQAINISFYTCTKNSDQMMYGS